MTDRRKNIHHEVVSTKAHRGPAGDYAIWLAITAGAVLSAGAIGFYSFWNFAHAPLPEHIIGHVNQEGIITTPSIP